MPWFKVDDGFHSHPKTMRAGTAAVGLWVRCGSYCAQHLTDGFVPVEVANAYGTKTQIKALVDAELWLPEDGGWRMHDYLERNPSRVEVEKDRAAATERQRRAREASRMSRRDSHSDSERTSGAVTFPPTRPDPTPTSSDVPSWSSLLPEKEVEESTEEIRATIRQACIERGWPIPDELAEDVA